MVTAFKNKQSIKDEYLKRVQEHYELDEIKKGVYWENGKGGAVGCTVENNNNPYEAMEQLLGIPIRLAYLEDVIFEGLDYKEAKEFPKKFLEAIPVGADLSMVYTKFIIWLFDTKNDAYQNAFADGKRAISKVRKLYKRKLAGEVITDEEWKDARAAAWAAASAAWSAESAARAAASAGAADAAAWAADAAAWAADAAWAAESAAWSAESAARAAESAGAAIRSAAWSAKSAARAAASAGAAKYNGKVAESAKYSQMANKLLGFLKKAK